MNLHGNELSLHLRITYICMSQMTTSSSSSSYSSTCTGGSARSRQRDISSACSLDWNILMRDLPLRIPISTISAAVSHVKSGRNRVSRVMMCRRSSDMGETRRKCHLARLFGSGSSFWSILARVIAGMKRLRPWNQLPPDWFPSSPSSPPYWPSSSLFLFPFLNHSWDVDWLIEEEIFGFKCKHTFPGSIEKDSANSQLKT